MFLREHPELQISQTQKTDRKTQYEPGTAFRTQPHSVQPLGHSLIQHNFHSTAPSTQLSQHSLLTQPLSTGQSSVFRTTFHLTLGTKAHQGIEVPVYHCNKEDPQILQRNQQVSPQQTHQDQEAGQRQIPLSLWS